MSVESSLISMGCAWATTGRAVLSEIMEKPPDRWLYGVGVRIIKYVSRLKIARVKP